MRYLVALSLMFVFCVTSISIGVGIMLTRDTRAGIDNFAHLPEHFSYFIDGTSVTIYGLDTSVISLQNLHVNIPDTINGFPVTEISNDAFFGLSNMLSVIIPDTVTTIRCRAFGYTSVLDVRIPSSMRNLSPIAFSGSILSTVFVERGAVLGGGYYLIGEALTSVNEAIMNGGTLIFYSDMYFIYWGLGIYESVHLLGAFATPGVASLLWIHTEYDTKPSTWSEHWNVEKRVVVWGWPNFFFDLTFASNGGHFDEDYNTRYIQRRRWGINKGLPLPTRPGFEFIGWSLPDEFTGLNFLDEDAVLMNAEAFLVPGTVFSHWEMEGFSDDQNMQLAYMGSGFVLQAEWAPKTFNVSFNFNAADTILGGIDLPLGFQHTNRDGIPNIIMSVRPSIPSHPTRGFLGFWNTPNPAGGMQVFDVDGFPAFTGPWYIAGDTRLYARFGEGTMHAVTFNTGPSDSIISSQSVEHGTFATRPPDPILRGYKFLNWREGSLSGNIFDFGGIVEESLALVAEFEVATYIITFMGLDGIAPLNPIPFTIYSTINLPGGIEREGWDFLGWFTAPSGGTQVTQIAAGTTGNQIVFAVWEAMGTGSNSNFFIDQLPTVLIIAGVFAGFVFLAMLALLLTRAKAAPSVITS